MASSLTIQVMLLCTIFSFPSNTTANKIPGLAILKDVNIWRDGEITSLGMMFGQDPEEWSGDAHVIADMAFTALCCSYSSIILDYIRTAENDFDGCKFEAEPETKRKCWDDIKMQLKSCRSISVQMVTTAFNYTKTLKVRADKNVLNAIFSFYLYVHSIVDDESDYVDTAIEQVFLYNFTQMKLYTQYLIEAFAVLNCSWSEFDVDELIRPVDRYGDYKMLRELNLPETYFKHKHFDPKILFLPNVSEIRLDHNTDKPFGYLSVEHVHGRLLLKGYSVRYAKDFRSEITTQSQTVVFQSIVSTVLYLISKIIEMSTQNGKKINSDADKCVGDAIDILKRFNFPGLLHVKLRQVIYQETLSLNSFIPLENLFEGLVIYTIDLQDRFETRIRRDVKRLMTVLDYYSNDLLAMEPEIKLVKEINQTLCDYEYEEVGFLQFDGCRLLLPITFYSLRSDEQHVTQVVPILERLKAKNCRFSDIVVVHFILTDFIVSQCKAIISDVNNLHAATSIQSCFDSVIKSIRSIRDTVDHSLVDILDTLETTRPYNNANRKIIDSILAMKLYLGNGNLLNSSVPLTERKSVDVNRAVSKLDALKRYNRYITNLIEQYTVHSCSTPSPREALTNKTISAVHNQCRSVIGLNDKKQLLKCVGTLIENNLKNYEPVESQIDRNDYTIENLSMNAILEKASSNNDEGLSMLHELNISWEGGYTTLADIVGVAKNNVNPKYLCKYQLIVIKAIVFIVYEKLKTIIHSSTLDTNYSLYRSNLSKILKAMNAISSDFVPERIFQVYEKIVDYFNQYFQRVVQYFPLIDRVALIRIISMEQYYLGMQNQSSGATVDETVRSMPDHAIATSSMPQNFETVVSSAIEMNGQTNIKQLLSYLAVVEEVKTNLKNVALVLYFKRMSNLQI